MLIIVLFFNFSYKIKSFYQFQNNKFVITNAKLFFVQQLNVNNTNFLQKYKLKILAFEQLRDQNNRKNKAKENIQKASLIKLPELKQQIISLHRYKQNLQKSIKSCPLKNNTAQNMQQFKIQSQHKSSRLPLQEFIKQQKIQSSKQLERINNSNKKLDLLEQKMKRLLNKDKFNSNNNFLSSNFYISNESNLNKKTMYDVEQYLMEESDKEYQNKYGNLGESEENDDILLENSNQDIYKLKQKKYIVQQRQRKKQFLTKTSIHNNPINMQQNQYKPKGNNEKLEVNKNKNNKSTSSLKIFNNRNIKPKSIDQDQKKINISQEYTKKEEPQYKSRQNNNVNVKQNYDINSNLNNFRTNVSDNFSYQNSPHLKPISTHFPEYLLPPSIDLLQINQLQQMMLKSLQIKQRQYQMNEQQINALQKQQIQLYRKNVELQVEFDKIKKFNMRAMKIESLIEQKISQLKGENNSSNGKKVQKVKYHDNQDILELIKSHFQQQPERNIFYEVLSQRQKLQEEMNYLKEKLKYYEEKQYQNKLQQKKQVFQLRSMERQFNVMLNSKKRKILSSKSNLKLKQNKCINTPNIQAQKQKYRSNQTESPLKPHLRQKSQIYNNQSNSMLKPMNSKTKTKLSKRKVSMDILPKRVSSRLNLKDKNRHLKASCQTKCPTDRILPDMVDELDKLKNIVNKQLIKTRATSRKTINLKLMQSGNKSIRKTQQKHLR